MLLIQRIRMRPIPHLAKPQRRHLRRRPRWLAIGWLMAGAVVVASIVPIPGEAPFGRADVLAHAGAYLLLMSWFSALYPRSARPWIAGLLLLLGVALEVVQHSLGHRMFEIADIAANAVGIALGWRMGRRVVLRLLDKVEYLIGFD